MSTTASTAERPYHHGDLKASLLTEAEKILEQDGIQALTLRAAARAAGVSHAAPANHFGDLTGLLSELAAVGFARFASALTAAAAGAGAHADPSERLTEMGRAYVAFARDYPGLFLLMFRGERLDFSRPALREAAKSSGDALRGAVGARQPDQLPPPLQRAAEVTAMWALVHGFAMLMLDGRLDDVVQALPGESMDSLLRAMLDSISVHEAAAEVAS